MNTEKLVRTLFSPSSSSRTGSIIALVGGLAVGAVIGVLFAPNSGKDARNKLCGAVGNLFGQCGMQEEEEPVQRPNRNRGTAKRPKSDLKSIIHEAHLSVAHPDQAGQSS